jgi:ankyrin repeat protein
MKTIVALLMASCVVLLAQSGGDNPGFVSTSPLSAAAQAGDTNEIIRLIKGGADVNAKSGFGTTPLMFAAMSGQLDAAKILLANGADIHGTGTDGYTALMVVGVPKQFDPLTGVPKPLTVDQQVQALKMSTFLLDNGADSRAKDNTHGDTALTHMALCGYTQVVTFLLDKGVDIEAKNNNGETALICCASTGETNMIKLLLARGANINSMDAGGTTALGRAKRAGNTAAVKMLQKAGAIALTASDCFFNPLVAAGTNTDSSGYVTNPALLAPFALTNSAGDTVTNAVLVKLLPNKFVFQTTDASATGILPLASLPDDLRKKFGYDPLVAQAADNADQHQKTSLQQHSQ